MKLVLATQNPGKLKELKTLAGNSLILNNLDLELAPPEFNPEETGTTFSENAIIKAKAAAALTHKYALSDDSGICVDALDGRPGVYSSRYSEGSESNGCFKLINELRHTPPEKRTAAYHCVMALVSPEGELLCQTEGIWRGLLIDQIRGTEGFGYDPIFYIEAYEKTVAEIPLSEKNKLSHRAQAWKQMEKYLLESKKL